MSVIKPSITFILLSHANDKLLEKKIREFVECKNNIADLLIVDSGNLSRLKNDVKNLIHSNNIKFIENESNGIYISMNNGIKQINSTHYIILGLDDTFNFDMLNLIYDELNKNHKDIIFLGVKKGNKKFRDLNIMDLKYNQGDFPSHTAGAVISKKLHDLNGYYDQKYSVCADRFFIALSIKNGANITLLNNIFSTIGDQGFSKQFQFRAEYETHLIRLAMGANYLKSFFILFLLTCKRYIKMLVFK